MAGAQLMKRIPRIKFPQRHPKPSDGASQLQKASGAVDQGFFLKSTASASPGGKASLLPKRTPVSQEEIETILEKVPFPSTSSPAIPPSSRSFGEKKNFKSLARARFLAAGSYRILDCRLDRLLSGCADLIVFLKLSYLHVMDDSFGKIKVIPDYFIASSAEDSSLLSCSASSAESLPTLDSNYSRSKSQLWTRRKSRRASFRMNLFSLRGLPWSSNADGKEKIELTVAEVESLKAELADLEERNAHLKAQLEQVDEILRSSCLSGYLHIRTRWTALPGEPPPIDDTDVDDWLPRFVVLHGSCLFFYLLCTDLSPQDSTLLSDITEIGSLPSFTREDEETRYCFYILTRQGLRYECSSISKIQVESWVTAIRQECDMDPDKKLPNGPAAT
ncbi:hypothetical protein SAY86_000773 [Trapa natans]|uniref:PH domain-containing protein n=1 Tax=Trapa natans TaxID=22666 RepID=A0AAN7MUZ6_TRANT|nr:hypothetical protein SAY86_000773 [Trapa natans]